MPQEQPQPQSGPQLQTEPQAHELQDPLEEQEPLLDERLIESRASAASATTASNIIQETVFIKLNYQQGNLISKERNYPGNGALEDDDKRRPAASKLAANSRDGGDARRIQKAENQHGNGRDDGQ